MYEYLSIALCLRVREHRHFRPRHAGAGNGFLADLVQSAGKPSPGDAPALCDVLHAGTCGVPPYGAGKSIIKSLGSDSFNRLKIGIYEETNLDTIDYVLKKFSKKSLEKIENNYIIFSQIIDCFINNGIEKTMNLYNRK